MVLKATEGSWQLGLTGWSIVLGTEGRRSWGHGVKSDYIPMFLVPSRQGTWGRDLINVFLSHPCFFLSPPPSLKTSLKITERTQERNTPCEGTLEPLHCRRQDRLRAHWACTYSGHPQAPLPPAADETGITRHCPNHTTLFANQMFCGGQ